MVKLLGEVLMRKFLALAVVVVFASAWFAASASAHVHGITPLITLATACGVTDIDNTGANRTPAGLFTGLIPPLDAGQGGRSAPVGCATHGP